MTSGCTEQKQYIENVDMRQALCSIKPKSLVKQCEMKQGCVKILRLNARLEPIREHEAKYDN